MNRQRRRDVAKRIAVVHAVQEVRDERPVPVVGVDDVGEEVQGRQHLEHGAAEIDRARVVIAKTKHAIAVVQRRAIHEIHDHLAQPALEDRRGHLVRAERHLEVAHDGPETIAADVDLPVAG